MGELDVRGGIETARLQFQALIDTAAALVDRGQDVEAVAAIKQAANLAHYDHTGFFSSPELERLLETIGKRSVAGEHSSRTRTEPARVLHVLTHAQTLRGTTRMVWRWIGADPNRQYEVAITSQQSAPLPAQLVDADAPIHLLDDEPGDTIARATRLRRLARDFDVVVLHIDPADVIPNLAFSGRVNGPVVVLYNQMDHTFWLGGAVADVVANARRMGSEMCIARRGLTTERLFDLPLVIDTPSRQLLRGEAKAQLGLQVDDVLLLTAAVGYKYSNVSGTSFFDLVRPVLQRHENAYLVACGPELDNDWRELEEQTNGRARCAGPQDDLTMFHEAADIYVDSFPFGSLTSALDAGKYATPVVSFRPADTVLTSSDPALDIAARIERSAPDFQYALSTLITSPDSRVSEGEMVRDAISLIHTSYGWRWMMDEALDFALASTPVSAAEVQSREFIETPLDLTLYAMHQAGGMSAAEADLRVK